MKKALTVILMFVIIFSFNFFDTTAFAYDIGTYKVLYNGTNIRSGAALTYPVVGQLNSGDTINIIAINGEWGKIEGIEAWIRLNGFATYIGGNSNTYKIGNYSVLYKGTNIRNGAGLNYPVIGQLNTGDIINIIQIQGEWGLIENRNAWIRLNGYATYIGSVTHDTSNNTIKGEANLIIEKALQHVGYIETTYTNGSFWSKFGEWYGQQVKDTSFAYQPWCAMFISELANEANISKNIIPLFASCGVGVEWFKKNEQWYERNIYTPKKGDIIFFTSNGSSPYHVGIVEKVEQNTVFTIEGNVHDGNYVNYGVRKRSYDINSNQILGYGVPAYE